MSEAGPQLPKGPGAATQVGWAGGEYMEMPSVFWVPPQTAVDNGEQELLKEKSAAPTPLLGDLEWAFSVVTEC